MSNNRRIKLKCKIPNCPSIQYHDRSIHGPDFKHFFRTNYGPRRKMWNGVLNALFPNLDLSKTYHICGDHFDDKSFNSTLKNMLHRVAIPMLRLQLDENGVEIESTLEERERILQKYRTPNCQVDKENSSEFEENYGQSDSNNSGIDRPKDCFEVQKDSFVGSNNFQEVLEEITVCEIVVPDVVDDVEEVASISVCRLCLTNENVSDITTEGFKSYDYDNIEEPNNIVDILKKYTHIEFLDPTTLSINICASCHKMLQCMQLFANMCRKSENCLNIIDKHKVALNINPVPVTIELAEKTDAVYNNLETKFCNILSVEVLLNSSISQAKTIKPTIELTMPEQDVEMVDHILEATPKVEKHTYSYTLCHMCGGKFPEYKFHTHTLKCDLISTQNPPGKIIKQHGIQCSFCDAIFERELIMKRHIEVVHWSSSLLCELCGVEVTSKQFASHFRNHSRAWLCETCGEQFQHRSSHYKHVKRRHTKVTKSCKWCHMPVIDMKQHRLEFHPKTKECAVCNIVCSNKSTYEKHMKSHEQTHEDLLCNICGMSFEREGFLSLHMLTHGVSKVYKCHICKEEFVDNNALLDHKDGHKIHQCKICDQRFYEKDVLYTHMELQHLQSFKCGDCGKCFMSSRMLERHSMSHSGVYAHTCSICGQGFPYLQALNKHIKNVHNDGLRCKKCGKLFANKKHLYRHEMMHAGVRQFVCPICLKGFKSRQTLTDHSLTHDGQTSYKCPNCNTSVVHKSSYKLHLKKCKPELVDSV